MKVIATRLVRGSDLKLSVEQLVKKHNIQAGTIASCVGCVSSLSIRLAGAKRTLQLEEPLEIVSLMGTLTPEHQHIHIAVANESGNVIGGHLLEGAIIDTTAELFIHHYSTLKLSREHDECTGYTELSINAKSQP